MMAKTEAEVLLFQSKVASRLAPHNLIRLLECKLDALVYRVSLTLPLVSARQLRAISICL